MKTDAVDGLAVVVVVVDVCLDISQAPSFAVVEAVVPPPHPVPFSKRSSVVD